MVRIPVVGVGTAFCVVYTDFRCPFFLSFGLLVPRVDTSITAETVVGILELALIGRGPFVPFRLVFVFKVGLCFLGLFVPTTRLLLNFCLWVEPIDKWDIIDL